MINMVWMGQNFSKYTFTVDRPFKTFWVLFVPVYVLAMLLISVPIYIAGIALKDFFADVSIPPAVGAVFSLRFLKD